MTAGAKRSRGPVGGRPALVAVFAHGGEWFAEVGDGPVPLGLDGSSLAVAALEAARRRFPGALVAVRGPQYDEDGIANTAIRLAQTGPGMEDPPRAEV